MPARIVRRRRQLAVGAARLPVRLPLEPRAVARGALRLVASRAQLDLRGIVGIGGMLLPASAQQQSRRAAGGEAKMQAPHRLQALATHQREISLISTATSIGIGSFRGE